MFSTDNTANLYHCRKLNAWSELLICSLYTANHQFQDTSGQPEDCPKQEKVTQEIYLYAPRRGLHLESGSREGPSSQTLKMQNGFIPLSPSHLWVLPVLRKCQHFLLQPEFSGLYDPVQQSAPGWNTADMLRLLGTSSWRLGTRCIWFLILLIGRLLISECYWYRIQKDFHHLKVFNWFFRKTVDILKPLTFR